LVEAIEEAGGVKSLYSYFYLSEGNIEFLEQAAKTQSRIFIDSGGFSAYSRDAKIDIDEYCDWLLKHESEIDVYAVLDKIGDPKGTMKNQRHMESRGLKPLPAFHYGSDLQFLKEMASEYDYIALGGLVPLARQKAKLKRWLDKCFNVIRTDAKVHGFGMTGVEILKRYPFYSVDSTSWLGGSIRSEVYRFEAGEMKVRSTKDREKADHESIHLADDNDKRWFDRVVNNCREWMKFEDYVTRLWEKRGISFDE